MAFLQFKFDQVTFQSRDIFNTYIYETDDTIADVLTTGYFDACRFAQSDDWVGSIIQCKCSDTYAEVYALANGATELVMPTAADVNQVVKFPQSPIQPQYNKITQGVVVCCFDGTDKKIVHMSDSVGVIESYSADNVAAADANNQGGETINKVTSSRVATSAVLGILTPRSISSSVPLLSAGNTAYDESIGRTSLSETSDPVPLRFEKPTALSPTLTSISFGDRNVYDLTTGKVVNFWVKNRAKISFWCGAAATYSATVRIDINRAADGTSPTYSLAGQTGRYEIEIPDVGINGYVSIGNATTDKCYVMGVNITPIQEADTLENYDAFTAWYHTDYLAADFYWIGPSKGANDFALRRTGGKTFGSFHGGHSNEVVNLNNGKALIASASFTDGEFAFGKSLTFTSVSDLTDGVITADCTQKATFFQGGHRIESSVNFDTPTEMTNMYTGMTCTNERFSQVISPIATDISLTAEGVETQLGPVSEAVQYDPVNNHSIETKTTWFNHNFTARQGAYILNRDSTGDYKFYFDSMDDSDKISSGFLAVTYHLFNS